MDKEKKYIGAVDQGTTSTRFVIFNKSGEIVSLHQIEHKQYYPKAGWVEHDPMEIINNTYFCIQNAVKKAKINYNQIAAIGITNQRETTVVWDKKTGKSLHNAIVWQDARTDIICKKLIKNKKADLIKKKTGLPVATYFSGPKIKWIIENVKGIKDKIKNNEVLFGNIDTWLIWNLTGGVNNGIHVTDVTNASRTMLMNLKTLEWDNELLKLMGINKNILPEIKSSSEVYGYTDFNFTKEKIPISGDLGDQQAALFGQTCFETGDAKNTYGTGCFLLLNTGSKIINSKYGLITTVANKIGNGKADYALEGAVALAGSLVQWFRDNFGLIKKSSDIEELAKTVNDSGGIYFVPAFSGLFAPYWKSDARGLIIGLTHYINKSHIARSILEATAYQTKEIFEAMKKDAKINFNFLKVDGGMVNNELLMQFQSDMLGVPVIKPKITETTVLGAAYAAGLAVGYWKNIEELKKHWQKSKEWKPIMDKNKRDKSYKGWLKAVQRTFDWV